MPLSTTSAPRRGGGHRGVVPDDDRGRYAARPARAERRGPGDRARRSARDGHEVDLEGDRLLGQQVEVGPRGQGHHPEPVGVAQDDVERPGELPHSSRWSD